MKMNNITGIIGSIMLILLVSSFTRNTVPAKFTPVGTWEYSVPGVSEGYDRGLMVISEGEEGIIVSIGPSEDYLVPAEVVEYAKKTLSFKLYVEDEEIKVKGTFDKDQFTGTVNFVEGVFDMSASRQAE